MYYRSFALIALDHAMQQAREKAQGKDQQQPIADELVAYETVSAWLSRVARKYLKL